MLWLTCSIRLRAAKLGSFINFRKCPRPNYDSLNEALEATSEVVVLLYDVQLDQTVVLRGSVEYGIRPDFTRGRVICSSLSCFVLTENLEQS